MFMMIQLIPLIFHFTVFSQSLSDSICTQKIHDLRDSVVIMQRTNLKILELANESQKLNKQILDSLMYVEQGLKGYVQDGNGQPLPNARIQLRSNDYFFTVTDAYGFFRLRLPVNLSDREPISLAITKRGCSVTDSGQLSASIKRHPGNQSILQDRIQITMKCEPVSILLLVLEYELGQLKPRSFVQDQLQESLIKNQFDVYDAHTIWASDQIKQQESSFRKGDYRMIIDETKTKYQFLLVGTVETIESKTGSVNLYGQSSGRVSCWGSVSIRLINLKDTSVQYVFSKEAIKGISVGDVAKASIVSLKNIAAESVKFLDEFYFGNQ
jgi:hypothetical protein